MNNASDYDSASATSSMEVTDRIASLEQRVQMQEDEIQLLKSALADVVRRLNLSEEQQATGSRRGPTKVNHAAHCTMYRYEDGVMRLHTLENYNSDCIYDSHCITHSH
ncbi:hypothetical protein XENOCAPTIV_000478, partial [Xenoophorus captivus]